MIKLPAKNLSDIRSIVVCEILVVGLQYKVTTIKFCLKQFHSVENPITFFFPGMPVQLSAIQDFAEKSYHIDWKDNPFERAEQENIESPDELLAMIPVSYTHLTLPTIYSV